MSLEIHADHAALEEHARAAVNAASGGAVEVLVQTLTPVATSARGEWYDVVNRRTGRTGDIQVHARAAGDVAVVSIGSTRTDRTPQGPFVAQVVAGAAPGSRRRLPAQHVTAPRPAGARVVFHTGHKVVLDVPNERAGKLPGVSVLRALVTDPARAAVEANVDKLAAAVAVRLERVGG